MSTQSSSTKSAVSSGSSRIFERRSPISGAVVTRVHAASVSEAVAAADAAARAFEEWSSVGPSARRAVLSKAADLMEARRAELVELMCGETGATAAWAHFNVALGAGVFREAAAMTTQISGEVIPSDKPGCLAMAVRAPVGVVLGIAPWNAPIILGARAVAMPLACGNSVILKASEASPGTHQRIGQILIEAGVPNAAIQVVTNQPADAAEVVGALIAHPAVRRINFTGSTHVGRLVAEAAARQLKPVLLELGGKAPIVVLEDADIEAAVNAAAFGAFMNQGQICMSTERAIVSDKIADEFVQRLARKAQTLKSGDPSSGDAPLGAMISREAAMRVGELVQDAVERGARLVAGGRIEGAFMDATVLDGLTPQMRLYSEESFGPVIGVVRFKDVADAIRIANDSDYGLSAAVFSRDIARAIEVAKRLQSGICHINGATVHDEPQMPFGGVKQSGYGRFGGKAAIDAFSELRWITVETSAQTYPI